MAERQVLAAVDELRRGGLSASATLEEMAATLQQAAVEQALPGSLADGDDDAVVARGLAAQMAADEVQLLYSIVIHGRAELSLMSDEYGALTMVLLRLFAFPAAGAERPASARAAVRAQPLRAPTAKVATALSVREPEPKPVRKAADGLSERWVHCVSQLVNNNAVTALTRELAMQAQLLSIGDGADMPVWQLAVGRESLRGAALADKLGAAIGEMLGHPVRIDVIAGTPVDSPAQREAAEREQRQRAAVDAIESDAAVRALLTQFRGARIVPGSIKPI